MINNIIVADLHVNSKFGLWPPNFVDQFGNHLGQNIGQEYLYRCWLKGIDRLPNPIHNLIFAGDLYDGMAPMDLRWTQMTPNTHTAQTAVDIVTQPLRDRATNIYSIEGTRFHESPEEAEELARIVDAKPTSTGESCRPILRLKIGHTYMEVRHKLSGASVNTSTALQNELRYARAAQRKKGYVPSIIVGAHWHIFGYYGDAEGLAAAAPGFQLLNRYAEKRRPSLWMPDIGFLIITVYPERDRWGDQKPFDMDWILYPHPEFEMEEVEIGT